METLMSSRKCNRNIVGRYLNLPICQSIQEKPKRQIIYKPSLLLCLCLKNLQFNFRLMKTTTCDMTQSLILRFRIGFLRHALHLQDFKPRILPLHKQLKQETGRAAFFTLHFHTRPFHRKVKETENINRPLRFFRIAYPEMTSSIL